MVCSLERVSVIINHFMGEQHVPAGDMLSFSLASYDRNESERISCLYTACYDLRATDSDVRGVWSLSIRSASSID